VVVTDVRWKRNVVKRMKGITYQLPVIGRSYRPIRERGKKIGAIDSVKGG